MDSEPRQSLIGRIWRSGTVQAIVPDIAALIGVSVIGYGIWQVSRPGAWIYAGVVLVVGSVLVDRARAAARRGRYS